MVANVSNARIATLIERRLWIAAMPIRVLSCFLTTRAQHYFNRKVPCPPNRHPRPGRLHSAEEMDNESLDCGLIDLNDRKSDCFHRSSSISSGQRQLPTLLRFALRRPHPRGATQTEIGSIPTEFLQQCGFVFINLSFLRLANIHKLAIDDRPAGPAPPE